MAARWAQRMMPTTRQDFWVLYLREIMMRPRSSRDLSSVLLTCSVQTTGLRENNQLLHKHMQVFMRAGGSQPGSPLWAASFATVSHFWHHQHLGFNQSFNFQNAVNPRRQQIITWNCSHSANCGFNSVFRSPETSVLWSTLKKSTAATALAVSTVVCPENQPNADWLIDATSAVDGELMASSKLICCVL